MSGIKIHKEVFVVESDELGDDWGAFSSYEGAEAFVREQCAILAKVSFCNGGEVGLYGPMAGVPKAEIEQMLLERNLEAIVRR